MPSLRNSAPPDPGGGASWPPPPTARGLRGGRGAAFALRLAVAVLAAGAVVGVAGSPGTGGFLSQASERAECPRLRRLAGGLADATGTTLLIRTVSGLPNEMRQPSPAAALTPADVRQEADALDLALDGQESSAVVDDARRLLAELDRADHDPARWARDSGDRIELLSRLYQTCPAGEVR